MKRTLLYLLVGVISFAAFIVAFCPASAIWNLVEADVTNAMPGLNVTSVDGTLWQGNAALKYRDLPDSNLNWTSHPAALLSGQLSMDTKLSGTGQALGGPVHISANSVAAGIKGEITSEFVNPLAGRYGLTFPGTLTIEQLDLVTRNRWFSEASGTFQWSGGQVRYDTSQGPQVVVLPPLSGELRQSGEDIMFHITHQGEALINITLKPTGWARVEIKTRLFILAQLPWPATSDLDAPVLLLEEKLF